MSRTKLWAERAEAAARAHIEAKRVTNDPCRCPPSSVLHVDGRLCAACERPWSGSSEAQKVAAETAVAIVGCLKRHAVRGRDGTWPIIERAAKEILGLMATREVTGLCIAEKIADEQAKDPYADPKYREAAEWIAMRIREAKEHGP